MSEGGGSSESQGGGRSSERVALTGRVGAPSGPLLTRIAAHFDQQKIPLVGGHPGSALGSLSARARCTTPSPPLSCSCLSPSVAAATSRTAAKARAGRPIVWSVRRPIGLGRRRRSSGCCGRRAAEMRVGCCGMEGEGAGGAARGQSGSLRSMLKARLPACVEALSRRWWQGRATEDATMPLLTLHKKVGWQRCRCYVR